MEPLNPDIKSLDRIVLTKDEAHDLLKWGKANLDLVNAAKPMLREGLHVVLGSFTTYFNWLDDDHVQLGLLYTPQRFAVKQAVEEMLKGKDITAQQLQELARQSDSGVDHLVDAAHLGIQKLTGHIFVAIKEGRVDILDCKVEQVLLDILRNSKDQKWIDDPARFLVTACLTPIQALNAYVEFMEPEVKELKEAVEKPLIQHTHAAKKRKDKQRKPMTKLRKIYYVESLNQYKEKRGFDRHTWRWGVRGHFRHYKSGKTVFIRPYEKGKLREQRSTKTYTFENDEL